MTKRVAFKDIKGEIFSIEVEEKDMGIVGIAYKKPREKAPFKFTQRKNFPTIHSRKMLELFQVFSFFNREGIKMPLYSRGLMYEIALRYLRKKKIKHVKKNGKVEWVYPEGIRDIVNAYIYFMC